MKEGRLGAGGREEAKKKGRREEKWEGGGKAGRRGEGGWIHTKTPGFSVIPYFFIQNQTRKQEPLKSHLGMSLWPAT